MKTLTTLISSLYLLTWLFTLNLITTTPAADTLSVQGTVGMVKGTTIEGTFGRKEDISELQRILEESTTPESVKEAVVEQRR